MSLKHKCHICLWLSLNLILVASTTSPITTQTVDAESSTPSATTLTTLTNDGVADGDRSSSSSYTLSTSKPDDLLLTSRSRSNIEESTTSQSTLTTATPAETTATIITSTETSSSLSTSQQNDESTTVKSEKTTTAGMEKNLSTMDNMTTNVKTFNHDGQQENSNNADNTDGGHQTTPYLRNINLDDNDDSMSNEINNDDISRKSLLSSGNGLYRIKIGEITTDEFDNGLSSASEAGLAVVASSTAVNEHDKTLMETVGVESTAMPATVPMHKASAIEKVNIDVFYPSKLEDFKPVIEQSNEKLLREKNILRNTELNNDKLAFIDTTLLKPADTLPMVTINTDRLSIGKPKNFTQNVSTTDIEIELVEDTSESVRNVGGNTNIVIDITKALQENDAVITNIEEKFNVDDLPPSSYEEKKSTVTTTTTSINTPISVKPNFLHHDFIMRRVKKNDPIIKLNVFNTMPVKKIDFANTKFNTDNSHGGGGKNHEQHTDETAKNGKPEFSTTKFYNSKELSGEAAAHNATHFVDGARKIAVMQSSVLRLRAKEPVRKQLLATNKKNKNLEMDVQITTTLPTDPNQMKTNRQPISSTIQPTIKATAQQKKEKTGKTENNVKANDDDDDDATQPLGATSVTTTSITTTTTSVAVMSATALLQTMPTQLLENVINKTSKSTIPAHTLTHLQEKINSLDCEILNVPMESNVWRGNETHELNLPTTTPEDCTSGNDCSPMIISWEGVAEIQSGDILIVEINDTQLLPANLNATAAEAHRTTAAVYQVTRLGHEHCDITEGVLLDITPLVVDGKKLVTLYDKDLTEGINLLIVVSEPWGEQCVRLKVTVKSDNCGDNTDCSGKGVCFSNASMEGYECQCCSGFAGSHCEEIDACTPSPCTNNGICVDLSQGHEGNAYQCLCPYGYTGKNCQFESDPCNPSQCLNGGTCVGNSTHFRCDCVAGFAGPLCQHNLNECESSPCVHGICVDQEDGFRCFCQPGFSGELCNFEYNECESNPCINGGECIDHIGGFSCKCTRGYTGKRCHLKVDFCATDPCPDGHRCIDHGDEFTCECPGGRNGPDCNQVPRTLCNVNPCSNGGTCWTTEESFYCACRPGFTGKMCEDDFILETVVSSNEILSDLNPESIRAYEEPRMRGNGGPFEVHNGYVAFGTLAAAIMIVVVVVSTCYCTTSSYDKVHQTYRNFATKHQHLLPTFGRKNKAANTNRHWLSGKGNNTNNYSNTCQTGNGHINNNSAINTTNPNRIIYNNPSPLNPSNNNNNNHHHHHPERTIINHRPLAAMSLENDMYYTVDFSDSQNAPLIQ